MASNTEKELSVFLNNILCKNFKKLVLIKEITNYVQVTMVHKTNIFKYV